MGVGSGLVGLYLKSALSEWFTISRNWLFSRTLNIKASKLQKIKHMVNIPLNVGGIAVNTASNKKMCACV